MPAWVTACGPVTANEPASVALDNQVLRDQLAIYQKYNASWAIWTYKDIGLQGVVYAQPDSPWMQRVQPIVDKKRRLGTDAWGTTDAGIRHITEPIESLFATEFPNYQPFPFGARRQIAQHVRHMLLSEAMLEE